MRLHRRLRSLATIVCCAAFGCQSATAQSDDRSWSASAIVKVVAATETLDIDANNATDALTDGLLVLRYMFGIRETALVQGTVGGGATRTTGDIETYLAALTTGATPTLDIDGNGSTDALTDGLVILRYLFGIRGQPLIQGTIGIGATRTSSEQIETYLATLTASTPQPPTGCSIVASPASSVGAPLAPATPVQLTASCSGGQLPITHTWDSGAFVGSVHNVSPTATTTYSDVASNAAGSASAVTSTVHVAVQGPQNLCTGNDAIAVVGWPASGQVKPFTNGLFNQIRAFRIEIPQTFAPPLNITHVGWFSIAERPGNPVVSREVTISRNSCDFTSGTYLYSTVGDGNTAPTITFTVNNPGGYQLAGAVVNFQSGDVIYVNVRNAINGSPSCNAPACDINFDFATPNRY
ncbi:MAG: hypothetical protein ABI831_24635 [Betaproteobacteria bacterium]